MTDTQILLLVATIYAAPHLPKIVGLMFSVFLIIAFVGLRFFK